MEQEMIFPRPLHAGSRIAVVTPASPIERQYVDGAKAFLESQGFEVRLMPHVFGPEDGCFASSLQSRLSDLTEAWLDPDIDAILCSRGGYGTAELLPHLSRIDIRGNAKWLIGFSDISALHACLQSHGVASLHSSMAKQFALRPDSRVTRTMLDLLRGGKMNYEVEKHPFSRKGHGVGSLIGGNLAVLNGLASTPYDLMGSALKRDSVLFIEDVSEQIYEVERILLRLCMSGVLGSLKGLIVGRFTDYRPSKKYERMEQMIHALLQRLGICDIPVAIDFPVGHIEENLPMTEGATVELSIEDKVRLKQI